MNKHKVAIVMGSQSDGAVMRHASTTLDGFEIPFDSMLISAHRYRGYYDNAELFAQHEDSATFINVN